MNPSGKLPYTYPKYSNSLINYYHKPSEASEKMEGVYYYEENLEILFPFGFGLSYTTFNYDNLIVNKDLMGSNDTVIVSVDVSNTGAYTGKEVVQLFTIDHYAAITPDVKRLRAFKKVDLAPGVTKTISFKLSAKDLSFINSQNKRIAEAGEFTIQVNNLNRLLTLSESVVF